ncbi:hypothetical protein Pyn_38050 [Prunus yedoensis var. nudiflora]|uniref:Uncharacterized protein n=1 Tax=Prunus yedoensis var. nudiflora TaxID=2094558 RepID=A0A314UB80_PRUYE|nr:hypothetical protein Pyn_38050 [Prunus yedoensis var. nudiflora]
MLGGYTWKEQVPSEGIRKTMGYWRTQGRVSSFEPACIPISLPPSDIGHEKRKKEKEKMAESKSSSLKQPPEEAWSSPKSLILWDWADLIFATMR